MMEFIPLGTSSASIVQDRGLSSYVLKCNGDVFLFDCGDGTQFRLRKAKIRLNRIQAVFISHLHGDHYLGLFGILVSMSLARRTRPLILIAPEQLQYKIHTVLGIHGEVVDFPVEYVSLEDSFEFGEVYSDHHIQVTAHALDHGIFCVGYRVEKQDQHRVNGTLAHRLGITKPEEFQRLSKGETIQLPDGQEISPDQVINQGKTIFAYVSDTRPCQAAVDLAKNADLMVHEATFSHADEKRAIATKHASALDAAKVAQSAGAKKLLLTHFSARYPDVTVLENEACTIFPHSEIAEEFRVYRIDPDSEGR
ncbi:MAG: ribonuclease Z [Bacteroidetes bacterium]|nr:ribonuclease Z [Bacteroidota bacterium]